MTSKTIKKMKAAITWFEIPARDLSRARKFYESILDIEMVDMDTGSDLKMSMFPVEEGGISGALCEQEEAYTPSTDGCLLYMNANPDLQTVLDKVEPNGGSVIQTKTQITDDYGYMAIIKDSEGNRVALHSEH
ncbi:VOC family protein [Fodinibius sediminis]|uniref:VOC domain-containing protein n=1 Tax=Fodinibius sediminis TaxID=1214077 RepID=A0A521AQS0_9BACT|nr:VOC family protein [Fodinibius sediminis]SMO37000.1 hypothetical protein SAMN06265218_101283 [Fodinibius sediminis]